MESPFENAGTMDLRYEDVAQDGRPLLSALPPALGPVWRRVLSRLPDGELLRGQGILPILSRMRLDVTEHVVSPFNPCDVEGYGEKLEGTASDYTRVLLDVHGRAFAKGDHAILGGGSGEVELVGSMTAEHVLTRLFAERDRRRVTPDDVRAAGVGLDGARPFRPASSVVAPPEDARALDPSFVRGDVPLALGMMHSDSNQHVNSLVYPRLFEEAVLRRLAALGRTRALRARSLEVGFRRPSFVGDVLRVDSQLWEREDELIALGVFLADEDAGLTSARVFAMLVLAP